MKIKNFLHVSEKQHQLESSEVDKIQNIYGVKYYHTDNAVIHEASSDQTYHFITYIGQHSDIDVSFGDCIYFLSADLKEAQLKRGPCKINSIHCATIIRGYMPSQTSMSLEGVTVLPYVNGCSIRQLISPPRPGDPTLQLLKIPAYSAEQAHHIHTTVRVVYVLDGKGKCVVGMGGLNAEQDLLPGTVCILDPMCPHHFETPYGSHLTVISLHVFSSVSGIEANNPMYNGTHMMNQE